MRIPPRDDGALPLAAPPWTGLDAAGKRERVLDVAGRLFAREGLDAPMPALAEALGVGVGSIYRQVGPKEDIVAALVVRRMERASEALEAAAAEPDAWAAIRAVTFRLVDEAVRDHVTQRAWVLSAEHPAVVAARPRAAAALDALVARARDQGALRADVTTDDLRLALRTTKDAQELGPQGAWRLVELVLRGMAAPGRDA
jgi:AcrR family transcriptional regulator